MKLMANQTSEKPKEIDSVYAATLVQMPLTFKEALMASHSGLYDNGHHLRMFRGFSIFCFVVLCLDFVLCN